MTNKINVTVNGVSHQSEVEPRMLLVHYLREALNLTGTQFQQLLAFLQGLK